MIHPLQYLMGMITKYSSKINITDFKELESLCIASIKIYEKEILKFKGIDSELFV